MRLSQLPSVFVFAILARARILAARLVGRLFVAPTPLAFADVAQGGAELQCAAALLVTSDGGFPVLVASI